MFAYLNTGYCRPKPLVFASKESDEALEREIAADNFKASITMLLDALAAMPNAHTAMMQVVTVALAFRYQNGPTTKPQLAEHLREQFPQHYTPEMTDELVVSRARDLVHQVLRPFNEFELPGNLFTPGQWQQVMNLAAFNETYNKK